jgi:hypothetical protein
MAQVNRFTTMITLQNTKTKVNGNFVVVRENLAGQDDAYSTSTVLSQRSRKYVARQPSVALGTIPLEICTGERVQLPLDRECWHK